MANPVAAASNVTFGIPLDHRRMQQDIRFPHEVPQLFLRYLANEFDILQIMICYMMSQSISIDSIFLSICRTDNRNITFGRPVLLLKPCLALAFDQSSDKEDPYGRRRTPLYGREKMCIYTRRNNRRSLHTHFTIEYPGGISRVRNHYIAFLKDAAYMMKGL